VKGMDIPEISTLAGMLSRIALFRLPQCLFRLIFYLLCSFDLVFIIITIDPSTVSSFFQIQTKQAYTYSANFSAQTKSQYSTQLPCSNLFSPFFFESVWFRLVFLVQDNIGFPLLCRWSCD
jgi:hypothetical protein